MPTISVVVLHYGKIQLTEAALYSLVKNSRNENEIILVDNSGGEIKNSEYINSLAKSNKIKTVFAEKNLGFAGGMNLGASQATGEMLVLANNDIYVSQDWDISMLRHYSINPELGILATVTNMTGNEQKMNLAYKNMSEMEVLAKILNRIKSRSTYFVNNVAFIMVMIPAVVFRDLNGLDEGYDLGYFEDDDFCKRIIQNGNKIGIADDVFIHHEHGASFNLLTDEHRKEIFIKNKKRFESKWGKWIPHKYRNAPFFG
jgi:GT2 family glycosyltransferase